jgi:hypothetical protein
MVAEKEETWRALKGWQWIRNNHGSLYDRGMADSYYGRAPGPHYGGVGGRSGDRIEVTDSESRAEYTAGYNFNEEQGDFKDYS